MVAQTVQQNLAFDRDIVFDGDLAVEGDLKCRSIIVMGDLTIAGDLHAQRSVFVRGKLKVDKLLHADCGIRCNSDIRAGSGISAWRLESRGTVRAGRDIDVRGSIVAEAIRAIGSIKAGSRIHAADSIRAGGFVYTPQFEIYCQSLETRLLPLGRAFWAGLPLLEPWRAQILDPAMCWDDWRRLATPEVIERLTTAKFGHWSLEAQFRMFLGVESRVTAPAEASRALALVPDVRLPPPAPAPALPGTNDTNQLLAIVNSKVITPFPNYADNASYQLILSTLRQKGVLDEDLRKAYADLNIDLNNIQNALVGLTVPDPAVLAQINTELDDANNIRLLKSNLDTFLTTTLLADDLKITYVAGLVSAADSDAATVNVLGIFESILTGLSGIPDAGAIFDVIGAVVSLTQSIGGGFQTVSAACSQLVEALSTQFDKAFSQNGYIAQTLLTDWGKMQSANQLIINGTLSWPADDSAAVLATANRYEISVFQALLPIHWWPTYSDFDFNSDTRSGCGNTVWMQIGGWAAGGGPWVPYWLTYGGYWESDCSSAENELARIGISIEDLTMGTGLWGSQPFAYYMNNPLGFEDRPGCVGKG